MKFTYVILFFITITGCLNAQDERWDKGNGVYSNFKYGYTVRLENPTLWIKTSGNALHTDVKFENVEDGTIFFINIQNLGSKTSLTAWDIYESVVDSRDKFKSYVGKSLGVKVLKDNYKKVVYKGMKSIKTTLDIEIESDEFPVPMPIKQISYTFFVRQYRFTVTAKALGLLMEDDPNYLNNLFSCFGLIPTKEEGEKGIL